jgi:hypothetical protein
MKTAKEITVRIEATTPRSQWQKAVKAYALEMLEELDDDQPPTRENLLNGADDWTAYSYGGSSLVYDVEIAARLATPSELKRKKGGTLPPNRTEQWLDCQAHALSQAARLIAKCSK